MPKLRARSGGLAKLIKLLPWPNGKALRADPETFSATDRWRATASRLSKRQLGRHDRDSRDGVAVLTSGGRAPVAQVSGCQRHVSALRPSLSARSQPSGGAPAE